MKKQLLLLLSMLLPMIDYALDNVNSVYQIGTAEDFIAFAELVNSGEVNANAVLTTDIDKGTDDTMIGTNANKYQGTFDGKGHTIKINLYPEQADAALFWYTGFGAIIQNLKVEGTITTANKFAAGIVARNFGIIRDCYVDLTINSSVAGDATHGGIAAIGYGGTTIENCLAKITILGEATQNCGGVVGWAEKRTNIVNCLVVSDGSTLDISNGLSNNLARNVGNLKTVDVEKYNADPYANRPAGACYNNYVTNQWGDNVATTVVAYDDLADGRICYQLNNDQSHIAWVQQIGTDPFPVPAAFGSGRVYASAATGCDGKADDLTYSNTPSNVAITAHSFDKYGVCSVCGCFDFHMFEFEDPSKFNQADRSVLLRTVEDIDKVEGWNRIANGFKLNMKLMNDIKYIAEPGKYIFNNSDWIDGNFNGQGHAFTIGISEVNGYAGLFPEMTGNIENLILHGSLQTNGARVGSLCAEARMALVRNVYSDVDINSSVVGDNTSGGFFGWTGGVEKHIENCIYAGTFTLPGAEGGADCARVGGFAGWTAAKTYYTNCAVLGNIIGAGNQTLDTNYENSQNIARNPGSVVTENVYVVNPIFGNAVYDHDKYTPYENKVGIASGELAFFLNSKQNGMERFYQLIGTDPEPLPIPKEGGKVYWVGDSNYANEPNPNLTFIEFADANVKAICVANWDTNGDGELSEAEAAAVTSLGEVFRENASITSFNELQYFIELTSIEFGAFAGCSNLTSITIPNSVTFIGGYAFSSCISLTSITIPNSVTSIAYAAFYMCSALTTIVVEEGNTIYDSRNNCNAIIETSSNTLIAGCKNTTIPNSVISIGTYAFAVCSGLTSVTIPNSVTAIGDYAFIGCSGLTSVTIGNSVTKIGIETFRDCSRLTSVIIPNSVISISESAFYNCSRLTSVTIPNSVTSIGTFAFAFCSGLTSFTIPNSVTRIGDYAFNGCGDLTSVTIGSGLTSISNYAFQGCGKLISITIPNKVTSIGERAFFGCTNLRFVKVENALPAKIYENTFTNCSNTVLQVPAGSIASYQAADYWKNFKKIVDYIAEGDVNIDEDVNVLDVVDIARFVVGSPSEFFFEFLADINADGSVNLGDAVVLVNTIAGEQNFVKAWVAPSNLATNNAINLTGSDGCLSLNLENERSYTAFQFDLYVPDDTEVSQMLLNAKRKQGHQLLYNKVENGHYRVAALSTSNRTFDGDNGELLSIALNEIFGEEVSVRNIHFFDTIGNDYLFEDVYGSSPTSIRQIDNGQWTIDNPVYDLQGRKREKLQRGVNIVNGKKILF